MQYKGLSCVHRAQLGVRLWRFHDVVAQRLLPPRGHVGLDGGKVDHRRFGG
jgi:hypothetical protein